MADESTASEKHLTFNVKSSNDAKYVLTVPESMTVLDLKTKLSTTEYADIPADRQRLIYSGRVLKDQDALSTYNIKDGNTIHLVRGAASNQRQNPANQSSTGASNPAAARVPQNLAAGTGNDALAGLTGARYAGYAQMPGAGMFGPDGGMAGPGMDQEQMLRQLENPMFVSQMNEMMNNPAFLETMERMFPGQPMLRQMLANPEFRRMMTDPQMIRQSMQFRQQMQGGGGSSFPAPGVTDTTPQNGAATGGGTTATPNQTNTTGNAQNPFGMNPFAGFGGQQNPFMPFFGMPPAFNQPAPSTPSANNNDSSNTTADSTREANATSNPSSPPPTSSPPPNPFGSLFGVPPPSSTQGQQDTQQSNPFAAIAQQMMQNPQAMQQAMESMRSMGLGPYGGAGAGAGTTGSEGNTDATANANANANPFAALFGSGMPGYGGFGGFGMPGSTSPPPPQDTRPPEEVYAAQLGQLNDMGFFDFERNVRALRRSGGSVEGAVASLLADP